MCGRVVVDYDEMIPAAANSEISDWVRARPEGAENTWNLKPTQRIPLIATAPQNGEKIFTTAHWSIIPPWAPELKMKFPTFNARSETVTEKKTFAPAVKQQRCAIPVSAFYEWTGPKTKRTPNVISNDRHLLALAGLYSWWRDRSLGEQAPWVLTATILTRSAADVMAELHDRMPVFLTPETVRTWLDPNVNGDAGLVTQTASAAEDVAKTLSFSAVAPLRGDGPELIVPASEDPAR